MDIPISALPMAETLPIGSVIPVVMGDGTGTKKIRVEDLQKQIGGSGSEAENNGMSENEFLARHELREQTVIIAENQDGSKTITTTMTDATAVENISTDSTSKVTTIIKTVTPTSGAYKYIKTTTITPTLTGKIIKESYAKEEKR